MISASSGWLFPMRRTMQGSKEELKRSVSSTIPEEPQTGRLKGRTCEDLDSASCQHDDSSVVVVDESQELRMFNVHKMSIRIQ
jgi:hypothetical protein